MDGRDRDSGLVGVEVTGGDSAGDGVGGQNSGLRRDGRGLRQKLVWKGDIGALGFRQGGYRV